MLLPKLTEIKKRDPVIYRSGVMRASYGIAGGCFGEGLRLGL